MTYLNKQMIGKLIMLLVVLTMISCGTSKNKKTANKDQKSITIEFVSDENIDIANNMVNLMVFGFDQRIEDVPASIIAEQEVKAEKLPFEVKVIIPDNPEKRIKPKVTSSEDIKYYLGITGDINQNGMVDNGDLSIDYQLRFPSLDLDFTGVQKIYLKIVK